MAGAHRTCETGTFPLLVIAGSPSPDSASSMSDGWELVEFPFNPIKAPTDFHKRLEIQIMHARPCQDDACLLSGRVAAVPAPPHGRCALPGLEPETAENGRRMASSNQNPKP